jgi:chromosome transmission fidelity protein 1
MASNNDDVDYPTGRSVPFPFESPYPQQVDFMDTLLSSLRNSTKVLLMESPTGTGKSLSLACSAMAWLRYQEAKDLENKASSSQETKKTAHGSTADSWLEDWVDPEEQERQHQDKIMKERARSSRQALEEHLLTLRTKLTSSSSNNVDGKGLATKNHRERRENLVRSAVTTAKMRERQGMKKVKKQKFVAAEGEEDYCVADYKSDNEDVDDWTDLDKENDYSSVNDAVQQASELLQGSALDGSSAVYSSQAVGGVVPGSGLRKIVYAARTHSQLSQFVGELRRTHFADARVVALGGRQVLCGNSDINRPGRSEQSINDACLDLQKDKKFSCPLLTSKEGLATLALHTLVQPSDIEDAASLGKASHACSYYASRVSGVIFASLHG